MRWSLVLLAVLLIAGAVSAVAFRRSATARPPAAIPVVDLASAEDAGPSDDDVFAASMARLAEAKRRSEEEAVAAHPDASSLLVEARPDAGGALTALQVANDGGISPLVRAELEPLARMLLDNQYPAAVERVHALFRDHSPAAVPALELLTSTAEEHAHGGGAHQIVPVLARLQELPTSDPKVRGPLAELLGTMALASAREGQPERSRQQARAALALDERTPDAYLALGEYQFQDNDLTGALDTWENGLRRNPDSESLRRRLERGRAEAQRLGVQCRASSEHFVAAFDCDGDLFKARACLDILEAAYRSVGQLFEIFPEGPVPVVVYPQRSFDKEGHASWSAAVYDGKIRLPAAGADPHSLAFRGTLFHEYAHALLHRATAGKSVPTWLNEGLAEVARYRADTGPATRCLPDAHSFRLRSLEGSFQGLKHDAAWYAYLESRHATERLVERFGEQGVRAVLAEVSRGAPFAVAFEKALGVEYGAFTTAFDAEVQR
jgi:tetratricopeptide (TPR) repeat protein